MSNKSRPKLIAICGVDGVGKSSIVNYIEQKALISGAGFFRREKYTDGNFEHVKSCCPRTYRDHRDWHAGSFAKAVGTGIALDFIRYYRSDFQKSWADHQVVVIDRYVPCYLSFLQLLGVADLMEPVFRQFIRPDLTFYVRANFDVLEKRYLDRASGDDDEDVDLMRKFDYEYQRFFASVDYPLVKIDNSGEFGDTIHAIKQGLLAHGFISQA